ncbi:reverse transcriptase [Corchorus capsularis]|uniref:Reverse transcriptase n=1 Tax=Corchorus capsularis TaxID=210143 RepID=A0A1R3IYX5_COCAP|nr:reverse transcriptase [Corchorus capsularis]
MDIRILLSREWHCSLQHTYREDNFYADWLANVTCVLDDDFELLSDPPDGLKTLLDADARGVHDLPLEMQTVVNLKKIGDSIGRVVTLEKPEWNQGSGRCYMRLHLELDVHKPLIPGFWVPRKDKAKIWNCGESMPVGSRECAFGPWMRAVPVRSVMEDRLINVDEKGTFELPYEGPLHENAGILTRVLPESQSDGIPVLNEEEEGEFCELAKKSKMAARETFVGNSFRKRVEISERVSQARGNSGVSNDKARVVDCVSQGISCSGIENVGDDSSGNCGYSDLNKQITAEYVDSQLVSVDKGDFFSTESTGSRSLSSVNTPPSSKDIVYVDNSLVCNKENLVSSESGCDKLIASLSEHDHSSIIKSIAYESQVDTLSSEQSTSTVVNVDPTVLHQVEIGLSSFFRNLNLKRRFEDALLNDKASSKRMWVENENGFIIKYISNESSLAVDMVASQDTDVIMSNKANRIMGAGPALTVQALKELIRKNGPQILFIMETKNKRKYMENLKRNLKFRFCFYVEPEGLSGGLALLWHDDVSVHIIRSCKNLIDSTETDLKSGVVCRIFWVYGPPEADDRAHFWHLVKRRMEYQNIPWLCVGDFNDILYLHEKEGGNTKEYWKIRKFREMVDGCNLIDLPFQGQKFTWIGRRDELVIKERLDRVLVNIEWVEQFPNTQVFNNPIIGSDHSSILIDSNFIDQKTPRSFKFEIMWTESEHCEQVIRDGWSNEFMGSKSYILVQKQNSCRKALLDWSRKAFPNNKEAIECLKQKIAAIQDNECSVESCIKVEELISQLKEAWSKEEQYWYQRSRIKWLKDGDANTRFFHQTTIQMRQTNKILNLKSDNGEWIEEEKKIVEEFELYYSDLFTSNNSKNWDQVLLHVPRVVTDHMNGELTRDISEEEIRIAAFQLWANKAPGPDGYNGTFYQKYWEIVKEAVCAAVKSFFSSGRMLHEINNTNIILIPKTKNPESVNQFRPISLCNFVYKIISKILTNRLKPYMDSIITQEQGAFVGERQIQDNILIASEAFHYLKLKKKGQKYYMGLKLDMNKAYDRVEWGFLEAILEKFGFCQKWIKWIMECLSTVSYTLVINDKPSGSIIPSRGLRQGDPISPYLFLFVVDVLSRMVHSAVSVGVLHGTYLSRYCPPLTHLLFADDSLFFLAATKENCDGMTWILKAYCDASGQLVNLQESSIIFSNNTPADVRFQVEASLQIVGAPNPGTYLGVPNLWGKTKCQAMKFIQERIKDKLQGWRQCWLSQGGKEVLIKSVASALPTYIMSGYKLPKKLCGEINSDMASFWWGQGDESSKIHWLSWEKLTNGKEKRGIGFRNLEDFNRALLEKQGWRILTQPNAFWVKILKALYFKDCDFMEARKISRASWSWDSIIEGRKQGEIIGGNLPRKVAEIMDKEEGIWKLKAIKQEVEPAIINNIEKLLISHSNEEDRVVWPHNQDGIYSVKSGYFAIKDQAPRILSTSSSSHQCVWFGSCLNYQIDRRRITTFDVWIFEVLNMKGVRESVRIELQAIIAFICWQIWKARCAACFEKKGLCVEHVIYVAEKAVLEFQKAKEYRNTAAKVHSKESANAIWQKPVVGHLKINCDGAFDELTGTAACGVIVRDCNGRIIDGLAKPLLVTSSVEAEAIAVKEALILAKDRQFEHFAIETDSEVVQRSITSSPKDYVLDWKILPIVKDIKDAMALISTVDISWIGRKANMAANWVATSMRKGMCPLDWVSRPPSQLLYICDKDGVPAPP